MTLIITLIAKNRVVQLSDRRLTNVDTGEPLDNKAVAVGMSYVHFVTSYTGLAYIGSKRVDYWLQEHLGSITSAGEPSIEAICDSLGERAARAVSNLRGVKKQNKGLKIILAGYERTNHPFMATVSNIKFSRYDRANVRDSFVRNVRRYCSWSPMPDIDVAGSVGVFEAKDPIAETLKSSCKTVVRYLKNNNEKLTEEQVARTLLRLVRPAHKHPEYGHLIGQDCLSVVAFPREPGRK